MLILLLCEVGKKAPVHTYKISNIAKQQSFPENIKVQNCTYLGAEFTLPKLEPHSKRIGSMLPHKGDKFTKRLRLRNTLDANE